MSDKCPDLIRREDAFRVVLGVTTYDTVDDVEIHCDASIADSEGWLGGVRDALRAIEDVPSAEPERRWIPVTEALPEICQKDVRGNVTFSKKVLSCQKYGDGSFWQSIDYYTTNNGGGWLSEVPHHDPNDCCKVVAWMPLPEPYRGE